MWLPPLSLGAPSLALNLISQYSVSAGILGCQKHDRTIWSYINWETWNHLLDLCRIKKNHNIFIEIGIKNLDNVHHLAGTRSIPLLVFWILLAFSHWMLHLPLEFLDTLIIKALKFHPPATSLDFPVSLRCLKPECVLLIPIMHAATLPNRETKSLSKEPQV